MLSIQISIYIQWCQNDLNPIYVSSTNINELYTKHIIPGNHKVFSYFSDLNKIISYIY